MDIYPDNSGVSIPSGIVARSFRGWYEMPVVENAPVDLSKLKKMRGVSGLLVDPPEADSPLLLGELATDIADTEIWRGLLRPSLGGANA